MTEVAVRYKRKTPRTEVQVTAPKGAVTRVCIAGINPHSSPVDNETSSVNPSALPST